MSDSIVDLFVIGGGINGTGIARDAAGRGLDVTLCEKDDLGEWTSSRSGKLVHGGLRYLEYYEFRLVREALIEREVLLESAPHIIWPLRFVLPHSKRDRPAWLIRLGLFLYDHLGGRRRLPPTRVLKLDRCAEGDALQAAYSRGFEYSDCWVDDARLVLLNALDASERGARVLTRERFVNATRQGQLWHITTQSATGQRQQHRARGLVNAAGPWVNHVLDDVRDQANRVPSTRRVRLVKGSHLVVRKFWQGEHAYLLQNADRRVIFVNPYLDDLALIGTTDVPVNGEPDAIDVDAAEVDYLLATVNLYFKQQLRAADVLHRYAGVRPLFDDESANPSAVTRDYELEVDTGDSIDNAQAAPLLSVFGGKITTFRKLSEHALKKLQPWYPQMRPAWTATSPLPGGDLPDADFDSFVAAVERDYPALPANLCRALARRYGSRVRLLLSSVQNETDLGEKFAAGFYEVEARYLKEHEWAMTIDDVLWRRTKHGVQMQPEQRQHFGQWWQQQLAQSRVHVSRQEPEDA